MNELRQQHNNPREGGPIDEANNCGIAVLHSPNLRDNWLSTQLIVMWANTGELLSHILGFLRYLFSDLFTFD